MIETNAGKLRCDREEMDWLLKQEAKLLNQIEPLEDDLEEVRWKIRRALRKFRYEYQFREPPPEVVAMQSRREKLKAKMKPLLPMKVKLDGYIENRVAR